MTDNRQALPEGTVIGEKYRILSMLGSGGFGITYLAQDLTLDRKVAIKELLPGDFAMRDWQNQNVVAKTQADEDSLTWAKDRFMDEAKVLAQFDHPNIVHIHDYFLSRNTGYIVTSYEAGSNLNDFLDQRGRFSQHDVNTYVLPILEGLKLVHGRGYLHRDIKPDNIYINQQGVPILLDFGAARMALGARQRDVTTIITPKYAPLEQYVDSGNLGPWTDIYSLAAVMHKAIIGHAPPDAPSRIRSDTYLPLASRNLPVFDPDYLDCIDWALELNEEERPQTIAEWLERFQAASNIFSAVDEEASVAILARDHGNVAVVSATRGRQATRSGRSATIVEPKRRRGLVAALLIVAALLFAGGSYVAFQQFRPDLVATIGSAKSHHLPTSSTRQEESANIELQTPPPTAGQPMRKALPKPVPEPPPAPSLPPQEKPIILQPTLESQPKVTAEPKPEPAPTASPTTEPRPAGSPPASTPPAATPKPVPLDLVVEYVTSADRRLYDAWYADRIIRSSIQPRMNIREAGMTESEYRQHQADLQAAFTKRNNEVIQCCADVRAAILKLLKFDQTQVEEAFAARLAEIRRIGAERKVDTSSQQKLLGVVRSVHQDERDGLVVNSSAIRDRIVFLSALNGGN